MFLTLSLAIVAIRDVTRNVDVLHLQRKKRIQNLTQNY